MITKLMSFKLWLTNRTFPLVPLVFLSPLLHTILFVLFFVCATAVFIRPQNILFPLVLVIVEMVSMLGDELRWQPWAYQFIIILLAVVLNRNKPGRAINTIILVLASTYFFSGIFKCNGSFLYYLWLQMIVKKGFHLDHVPYHSFVLYMGLIAPAVEVACGVLLLLPRNYKVKTWLPISVHLFILLCFSPLALSYDYIVFPWNIALIMVVYLLFTKYKIVFSFRQAGYKGNAVIACLLFLLPVIGMFGYWPPFFSFKLYAARHQSLRVYIRDTASVPSEIKPYVRYSEKGYQDIHTYFSPFDWCNAELKVPIPPDRRTHESLQDSLKKRYGTANFVFVYR